MKIQQYINNNITWRFQKLLQSRIAGEKLPSILIISRKWQVLFLLTNKLNIALN